MRQLCLALLVWGLSLACAAESFNRRFYTEQYPPISFKHENKIGGLAPALVEQLLERVGEQGTIIVLPWTRAFKQTLNTRDSALFVTIRTAEREPLFKWVGPILQTQDGFYALKSRRLQAPNAEQLNQLGPIAMPRDWYYQERLELQGIKNVVKVNEPQQMYDMLRQGRVNVILTDLIGFLPNANAAGPHLGPDDVELLKPFDTRLGYIAFHPETDDEVIQRWQHALDEMKADGSFSRIYQQWLPGITEP